MEYKKSLFGKTSINSSDSEEQETIEEIELEYYETRNFNEENKREYGIEVVKKNMKNEGFNIESKIVNNISNEETAISKLLEIMLLNKVTPVTVDDIISDTTVLE